MWPPVEVRVVTINGGSASGRPIGGRGLVAAVGSPGSASSGRVRGGRLIAGISDVSSALAWATSCCLSCCLSTLAVAAVSHHGGAFDLAAPAFSRHLAFKLIAEPVQPTAQR